MMIKRRFGDQNYEKIKKICVKKGQLFVDTLFPPTNASLFLEQGRSSDIIWKRPAELHSDPHLFVEGASPNDVTQGILGNCWFVSACSALTHNQHLLNRVIPDAPRQEWDPKNEYAGVFRFRFWRFGRWVEVVIDDLLPTRVKEVLAEYYTLCNDEKGMTRAVLSVDRTARVFLYLEKVSSLHPREVNGCQSYLSFPRHHDVECITQYANSNVKRLYGCYENLVGGHLSDALQDVSGGVAETINVAKFLMNESTSSSYLLFNNLKDAFDNEALIVAAIAAKSKDEIEQTLDCGLVKGHAYAVTAVRYVELDAQSNPLSSLFGYHARIRMIRLQNPWGEKEWNGPWSDNSKEWEQVTESQKSLLGITVDEDGEFWYAYSCMALCETSIAGCHGIHSLDILQTSLYVKCLIQAYFHVLKGGTFPYFNCCLRYHEKIFYGEWTTNGAKSGAPNDFAGGCPNFSATFCNNPQYLILISEPGDVMLALTQKEANEGIKRRDPYVTIGIHVMKVEENRNHRVHQAMTPAGTSDYASARSVFLHLRDVPPGRYIVLPTTFAPREQSTFMLRIYSEHKINPRILLEHAPSHGIFRCRRATSVTRITIVALFMDQPKEINVYCILRSGNNKARTSSVRGRTQISWNQQFIFHRASRRQHFSLELWDDCTLTRDRLISRVSLTAPIDNDTRDVQLKLTDSYGKSVGYLRIIVASFDDPFYL
ncbi:calpain family cysteine protease [Dictyocaulus viviparus]|uniref:Calpain family cysteine protease n=1 Tax=Dictyocaulus viviparus TaxID=29172 RepID=A0A0D8XKQ4_DICVI|nr:calpain family cysteine protease [Dictyocaulus viviparus]